MRKLGKNLRFIDIIATYMYYIGQLKVGNLFQSEKTSHSRLE